MLDALLFRLHRTQSPTLSLYLGVMLVCSTAYSTALVSAKLFLFMQDEELGADAPGIHFSPDRRRAESALGQVLTDMPVSVVELGLGAGLMVSGVGMALSSVVGLRRRRRRA